MLSRLNFYNAIVVIAALSALPDIALGASLITAKVLVVRGKAMVLQAGKNSATPLKQGDRVREGETIATGNRSFAKLIYTDGTQMNLGPNSRIKIEQHTNRNEAGLIKLIGGKLRTKVSKDLLKRQEKDQTKLFIQTKTASMGVRGTDFDVIYNGQNQITSLITYEGVVAFARNSANEYNTSNPRIALAQSNTVSVKQGQYSGAVPQREAVSLPVKMSPVQFRALQTGSTQSGLRANQQKQATQKRLQNPLPPGVNSKLVQADAKRLENRIERIVGLDQSQREQILNAERDPDAPPPEGINDGANNYAPPAGGIVDMQTGIYIPPPPGSTYDPNAEVYIPPPTLGTIDPSTGDYQAPDGYALDPVAGFVATTDGTNDGTSPTDTQNKDFYGGDQFAPPPTDLNYEVLGDGVVPPPGGYDAPPPDGSFSDGPVDDPYCPDCDQQNPDQNNLNNEKNGPQGGGSLRIRVINI